MIAIDFKKKTIFVGDGLPSDGNLNEYQIFKLLVDILYGYGFEEKDAILNILFEWKIRRLNNLIQQDDGCSCGLIALIFLILILLKLNIDSLGSMIKIDSNMMIPLRIKIASSILSKSLFFSVNYVLAYNNIRDNVYSWYDTKISSFVELSKTFVTKYQNKSSSSKDKYSIRGDLLLLVIN